MQVAALSASIACAASALPVLSGDISGELQLFDGRLTIPWRATARPEVQGGTRFAFSAELPEISIRASLVLDATGDHGVWRIDEARADAAALFQRLVPTLLPDLPELNVTGEVTIAGEGDWREGGPLGPLRVTWHAPAVTGTAPELSMEDLSLDFTVGGGWADGIPHGDGTLRAARVIVAGATLEEVDAAYSLLKDTSIRVTGLRANAFGGTIDVAPFSWSADADDVAFGLEFDGIDLELLAITMPDLIRNARGEVRGQARLRWRDDVGLIPMDGELHEIESADVQVTLAPRPGFLTGNLPRRIQVLPDWLGRLAREWLAPENPAYATLERIEMGREPLAVDDFVLKFFPPDDPLGRTMSVRIEGHSRTDPLLEKVVLTINLSGPFVDLIRLAAQHGFQIDLTKGKQ